MKHLALSAVVAALLCGCTGTEGGAFSISFAWEEVPQGTVYLWVRIEERTDPAIPGKTLAADGPVAYNSGEGVALSLWDVANGDNRVVVVEGRDGENSGLPISWFGLSEGFSITSGKKRDVNVLVTMRPPNALLHEAQIKLLFGGSESATVGPADMGNATIRTRSVGAEKLLLARDESFTLDVMNYSLVGEEAIGCSFEVEGENEMEVCDISDYDLTGGAESPQDGPYTVFARFFDAYGYQSPVYKATVSLDSAGPMVITAAVSPPFARGGQEVVCSVTVHEPLGEGTDGTPRASLTVSNVFSGLTTELEFAGPLRVASSNTYVWTAMMADTGLDGEAFRFAVGLEDEVGNESLVDPLPDSDGQPVELVVDASAPALAAGSVTPMSASLFGLAGGALTFSFMLTESTPLDVGNEEGTCNADCPIVRIGNSEVGEVTRNLSLDDVDAKALGFDFSYSVVAEDWGEVDKELELVVLWSDQAGNSGEETFPEAVHFDFRPPTANCMLSPQSAKVGDEILLHVNCSEPLLGGLPNLDSGLDFVAPVADETTTSFTFGHKVHPGDPDVPSYAYSVTLTDPAGNAQAQEAACAGSGVLDATPPEVLAPELMTIPEVSTADGQTVLAVGHGDTVKVSFLVQETQGLAEGYPQVTLAVPGELLGFVQVNVEQQEGATAYDFELTLDAVLDEAAEGYRAVQVNLADAVGNITTSGKVGDELVMVDFTPPQADCLLIPDVGVSAYAAGQKVSLQVTPFEELAGGGPPELVEEFDLPPPGGFFEFDGGTTYRFSGTVEENHGEQSFAVRVLLEDLVGNATDGAGSACQGEVGAAVDGILPEILGAAIEADVADKGPDDPLGTGVTVTAGVLVQGTAEKPAVNLGEKPMALAQEAADDLGDGTLRWHFARTLDGTEGSGTTYASVNVADSAGNAASYVEQNDYVTLDFVPPAAAYAHLFLMAPPGSNSVTVSRVTNGTTIHLTLTATELLESAPVLTAEKNGAVFGFVPDEGNVIPGTTFLYAAVAADLPLDGSADGEVLVSALLVDRAGNEATEVLEPSQPLIVDTQAPAAPGGAAAGSMRLYRTPTGSRENGFTPAHEVRGCPAAAAGTGWAWCPADGEGAVDPGATVSAFVALDGGGPTSCSQALVGIGQSDGSGKFVVSLNADWPGVCVSQTDQAGNESPPAELSVVEWVTNLHVPEGEDPSTSPHRAHTAVTDAPGIPYPRSQHLTELPGDDLGALGAPEEGGEVTVAATPRWRAVGEGVGGLGWTGNSFTYDPKRGRFIQFGGCRFMSPPASDQWNEGTDEFDGQMWHHFEPDVSPGARVFAAFGYDREREVAVLFGGNYKPGSVLPDPDTWEWDGQSWTQRFPETSPGAMTEDGFFWDGVHHRLLLLGRDQDLGVGAPWQLWSFDGANWSQSLPATTDLPSHDLEFDDEPPYAAYDAGRARLVVALRPDGLSQETWEWDGMDWSLGSTSAWEFANQQCRSLYFHPGLGAVLARCGGVLSYWTGESWESVEIAGDGDGCLAKGDRLNHFDEAFPGPVFLHTGYNSVGVSSCLRGHLLHLTAEAPGSLTMMEHSTYDPLSDSLVLDRVQEGNRQSEWYRVDVRTLLFDGQWYEKNTQVGDEWKGHEPFLWGTGFDPVTQEPVMVCQAFQFWSGNKYTYLQSGSFDGQNWVDFPTGAAAFEGFADEIELVHVEHLGALHAFSGEGQIRYLTEAGTWQGTYEHEPPPGLSGRPNLVYHPGTSKVVTVLDGETWSWDENGWVWLEEGLDPGSYDVPPGGMNDISYFHDATRGQLIALSSDHESCDDMETWQFDGQTWSLPEVAGGPAPRVGLKSYFLKGMGRGYALLGGSAHIGGQYCSSWVGMWEFAPAFRKPHVLVDFDLMSGDGLFAAGADANSLKVREISVAARAGGLSHTFGTGNADGETVPGFQVHVSSGSPANWHLMGEATAGSPEEPQDGNWSVSDLPLGKVGGAIASSPHSWLDKDGHVLVAVSTREATGASITPATLSLDFMELHVVYERGPECAPDDQCCRDDGRWADDQPCLLEAGQVMAVPGICRGGKCRELP